MVTWRSSCRAAGTGRPEHHDAVAAALGARSLVLPGADHLLEVPGDVMATLDGFRVLAETVLQFLADRLDP